MRPAAGVDPPTRPGTSMSREYPEAPIVGVGVVVWRGDEVLLIRRGKAPRAGSWSLPGGRQKLGETCREAGAREVVKDVRRLRCVLGLD